MVWNNKDYIYPYRQVRHSTILFESACEAALDAEKVSKGLSTVENIKRDMKLKGGEKRSCSRA